MIGVMRGDYNLVYVTPKLTTEVQVEKTTYKDILIKMLIWFISLSL